MKRQRLKKTPMIHVMAQGLGMLPLLFGAMSAHAGLDPLKKLRVPEPPNLSSFVTNKDAAIRLGKALFWDMQMGSDGNVACASCHFQAGADSRSKNQLNPGLRNTNGSLSTVFDATQTGAGGPNYAMSAADFPFHKPADPNKASSSVLFDSNDIVGSQGVTDADFVNVILGNGGKEDCSYVQDGVFHVNGSNTRRNTPRNTPSNINAIFNFVQFWDGRASNDFNGVNPAGKGDLNARVYVVAADATLQPTQINITKASLASQAVGPPGSDIETSCANRPFAMIGRKLLDPSLVPLAKQTVAFNDSVLGTLVNSSGKGLSQSYAQLIQSAFKPQYWSSNNTVSLSGLGSPFTQMEANFSLFWGLSIQLYEASLVSDNTPYDQFLGGKTTALTPQQKAGFAVFKNQGRCTQCHDGALLSRADKAPTATGLDPGFINIGVRPTSEDTGDVIVPGKGRFKTPALRNVALNGPYFHNGGAATLRQVVDFYNRGGDFANAGKPSAIRPLGLTEQQKNDLVAFLLSLTDDRVRCESKPFDHPQLIVINGHQGNEIAVTDTGAGVAQDDVMEIPVAGATGRCSTSGGLKPFLNVDQFQP